MCILISTTLPSLQSIRTLSLLGMMRTSYLRRGLLACGRTHPMYSINLLSRSRRRQWPPPLHQPPLISLLGAYDAPMFEIAQSFVAPKYLQRPPPSAMPSCILPRFGDHKPSPIL